MASTPSVVAQELAEVRDLKALAEECGWDVNSKEYKDRLASINKKYKAQMKMSSMTVSMQGGSSSAKQTKQNFIWVDSATRDAGDMEEAVGLLPEVFGEGKYGTSGVLSRGGRQNFKAEECVWKRLSKDGKHYRIIQHSTGYFYQKGFLPSDTAEQDEDEGEEEINEGEGEGEPGLGEFSIQEKGIFNTKYHYISSYIFIISLCIMCIIILYHVYHVPRRNMIYRYIHDTNA